MHEIPSLIKHHLLNYIKWQTQIQINISLIRHDINLEHSSHCAT
jgi:hypothetical protein